MVWLAREEGVGVVFIEDGLVIGCVWCAGCDYGWGRAVARMRWCVDVGAIDWRRE